MTKSYARYALGVIAFANFLSYLDRQLVSALEEPIRSDPTLLLNETQFNLLWTLFTLGYMACSPFIGYFTDRYRRTRIFAVCILVWSLATIASGMATSTWVLFPARVLIGFGEAGCLVIGSSLIADYFARESRGRALAIFYLGLPIGGTFAFLMPAMLLDTTGWRPLFYIAGVPGFLVCVLIWLLIDPPRGGHDDASGHAAPKAAMKDYLSLLRTPTLLYIILAQSFAMVLFAPLVHNGVEFFIQARGMTKDGARYALGGIALVAGVLGSLAAGILGDRLGRNRAGAYATLAGWSFLAGFPAVLAGVLLNPPWLFIPAIGFGAFCIFLCMPAVNTHIANVTPPARRAMAWALAVFILHLLGDTLSPPVFGLLEGTIKDPSLAKTQVDPAARQTMLLCFSFSLIPASLCCFLAARAARRSEPEKPA